jgi:hypothetical protein
MNLDDLKWGLVTALRLINQQPMTTAEHQAAEDAAKNLGVDISASRGKTALPPQTLKLKSK